MNENGSFSEDRLLKLISIIQEKYPSFIREGARGCIYFTAFLFGSLSSLLFDISPIWAWLLWLIAAFATHMLCEQLYRKYVFAWYEAHLRFLDED